MDQNTVKIKKYGNRRLYSTSEKRYLTMPEIETLVSQGRTIQVTEAQTDRDITSEILTQILLEKGKAQHFPVDFLEQMVRLSEDTVNTFFNRSMTQSMDMMNQFQSEMEAFYSRFSPFKQPTSSAQPTPETSEIERLRARIDELEKKLPHEDNSPTI